MQESRVKYRLFGDFLQLRLGLRQRQPPRPLARLLFVSAPTTARLLFDEAHSEAWTIRPELAREMQPAHPGDASYAMAAHALTTRGFEVRYNGERALTAEMLGRGRARPSRAARPAAVRRPRAGGRVPAVDLLQRAEG